MFFFRVKGTFYQLFFEMLQRWLMGWLLQSKNGSFKKVDLTKINENTLGEQDVTKSLKKKKNNIVMQ